MQVKTRFVLTSCLTVIALSSAGCGALERSSGDTGGLPLYAPDASPTTVAARAVSPADQRDQGDQAGSAPEARALKAMSLTTKDVRALDLEVRPDDDGTSLDAPTLAWCGGTFPSESHRTARYAVTAWTRGARELETAHGEIVTYDSAASAAEALDEWREATRECEPVAGEVVLGSDGELSYAEVPSTSDPDLATEDNVVTRHQVTEADEGVLGDVVTVLMRHDNLVAVVTYEQPEGLPPGRAKKLRALAGVVAERVLAKAG